jgi:hypothetical protein
MALPITPSWSIENAAERGVCRFCSCPLSEREAQRSDLFDHDFSHESCFADYMAGLARYVRGPADIPPVTTKPDPKRF